MRDFGLGGQPNPLKIHTKVLGEDLSWDFLYMSIFNSVKLESVTNPARTISYKVLTNGHAPKTLGPFLLNKTYHIEDEIPVRSCIHLKIKLDASEAPEQSKTQVKNVKNLKKWFLIFLHNWQYQTFTAVLWIRIPIHRIHILGLPDPDPLLQGTVWIRIRILLSTSKSKKIFDSYCFVNYFGHFIF